VHDQELRVPLVKIQEEEPKGPLLVESMIETRNPGVKEGILSVSDGLEFKFAHQRCQFLPFRKCVGIDGFKQGAEVVGDDLLLGEPDCERR
jgi:hypothetical protein